MIAEANGGASLFHDDDDFLSYLLALRQMSRDRLLKVYAYCLLENELRLVVMPNRLMLSRIIQRLHKRHTMRMNKKHARMGHLFRDRFRSIVFCNNDLLDVVRSVHLWPVREGLLRRPEHYIYSSHGIYLGNKCEIGDFISTQEVLGQFSGELDAQRRAFARFVETLALESDDFGIDEIVPGIGASGGKRTELLDKAKLHLPAPTKSSVKTLAERAGLLLNISLDQLTSPSRRQDLVMGRRLLATAAVLGAERTVTEVAAYLSRDKAQISRLVAQGMDLLHSDEAFLTMYDAMKAKGARNQEL